MRRQIDPLKQHRELRAAQTHRYMRRLWPHEPPALQALGKKTQPIATPPQDLYPISGAAAEHEQLPGERILGELRLHQSCKSVEPFAQISRGFIEIEFSGGVRVRLHGAVDANVYSTSTRASRSCVSQRHLRRSSHRH